MKENQMTEVEEKSRISAEILGQPLPRCCRGKAHSPQYWGEAEFLTRLVEKQLRKEWLIL